MGCIRGGLGYHARLRIKTLLNRAVSLVGYLEDTVIRGVIYSTYLRRREKRGSLVFKYLGR